MKPTQPEMPMTSQKMHADQLETDADLVRALLEAQFPQWAELDIERFASEGTSNAIYRLGVDLAVRLPYTPGKTAQVDKEHRWVPHLAPRLPLAVPEPLAKGTPTDRFPSPWLVCRWLDGENAELAQLSDPCEAARSLAGFIKALQSIDVAEGPSPGEHNFHRGVPLAARN